MRVERALEKLNRVLAQRGITSSSTALAAALSSNAVLGAPAGMAALSTAAAASAAGGAGLGWLALMSTSKLPLAVSAAVLLGGAAVVGIQDHAARTSAAEITVLSAQNALIPGLEAHSKALLMEADQARSLRDEAASVGILRGQVRELEAAAGEAPAAAAQKGSARAARLDGSQPVFDLSRLDQRPAVLSQHRPEYPQQMRQAGAAGEALVDFVVGSDGAVYNATAVSSTDKAFAESAVQAVSQWVFKPGQVGGQNVYTHMQVPIVFTLSSDPPPPPSAASWF
jgi:TonB family protein